MSSSYYEGRARQLRRVLEKQVKTRADEEGKAAAADKAAARAEDQLRRASSASTASSKQREVERKRKEANKAREAAAKASGAAADTQKKIHDAEQKAARDRLAEEKAEARREATSRRSEEMRDRFEAQRTVREEAAREAAREREVLSLRERTAELEALVRSAQLAAPFQVTVLFMAGTIEGGEQPLRLDREVREIQQRVRSSDHREVINIEFRMATRIADILQALNEVKPDVVHFSGHGGEEQLLFEGNDGDPLALSNADLSLLLQAAPNPIRLAVFNSCDSATQAALACDHVDAAIGMDAPIGDEAAKEFAGQLYSSFGFGHDLALAFDQAKTQVALVVKDSTGEPRLYTRAELKPEELVLVRPEQA